MTVFSDDRVQEALKDFIPLTSNVHYTQNLRTENELTDFFWTVLEGVGQDRDQRSTTQGLFVFNATGHAYGWMNARNPERLVALLNRAKAEFDANPPPKLELSGERVIVKPRPPEGAIVARLFSRITPLPEGAHPVNGYVGRDHLWIARNEIDELTEGAFPKTLAARLVRFHLWDNIRGEPDPWRPQHIRKVDFRARASTDGATVSVEIDGEFAMLAPQGVGRRSDELPDTGYEGKLRGRMIVDLTTGKVTDFKLYAEGEAWGRGQLTPRPPQGRFPLKIAAMLVDDEIALEVPPQALFWGMEGYLNPAIQWPDGR